MAGIATHLYLEGQGEHVGLDHLGGFDVFDVGVEGEDPVALVVAHREPAQASNPPPERVETIPLGRVRVTLAQVLKVDS